jgi:hypothetical protein
MREIKFRVWDIDGKVIYKTIIDLYSCWDEFNGFDRNHQVVMQYTGLKDKNGKEIYEGDIFRDSKGKNQLVRWDLYFWKWGVYNDIETDGRDAFSIEIIGNIYENPELIQE